jgi:hypothetical protein
MTVQVQNLLTLDETLVVDLQEFLNEMLQELDPTLDTKRGVLGDLLGYYGAILAAANQTNIDRVRQSSSLLAIEQDPTLADDNVVEAVLSNFLMERKTGAQATGQVTIVLDASVSVTISQGAIFSSQGLQFFSVAAFVSRLSQATVQSSNDRLLTQLDDGNYAFTIDVKAVEVGSAGRLSRNASILPDQLPPHYLTSYATADFLGGENLETNEELIARMREGLAAKALSGRTNMNAALRAQPAFSNIVATSIVGLGDPEMLRDAHTIFPVSLGGRVDWYIRTQERPLRLTLKKAAVLIEKTANNRGIWQFAVTKDEFPGFYDVDLIVPTGTTNVLGGYPVVSDTRAVDLTGSDWVPDIVGVAEGAYSPYQTAVIRFEDTDTLTQSMVINSAEQTYDITLRGLPLLKDIQTFVNDRSVRNYGGDCLIKAPIPCFLAISFVIFKPGPAVTPDLEAMTTAICQAVNRYNFVGRLPVSLIADTAHNFLDEGMYLSAIDLLGRIRRPDGIWTLSRSNSILTIADDHQNMVTGRTVCFFAEPTSISIAVSVDDRPDI